MFMSIRLLAGAAALVALPAFAQGAASAPPAGPAAPAVSAPSTALRDYRPWREPEPLSWRAANDTAAALGGHVGQLRGRPAAPPASDRSASGMTKDAAPRVGGSK